MTNKKKLLLVSFITVSLMFSVLLSLNNNIVKASDFSSSSAEIVMETNSKRVLYSKNANEKKYMASTTKILTAIVVIENCEVSNIVTVGRDTIGIEGSSIYLQEGEELSVKDLLYGLMLRSGNDCAETLANFVAGSNEKFALLMNETAKRIGAVNSNFVNPHGLHDDNHYTTAYDLALISSYAIKNPIFKEIVSTKKTVIPHTKADYDRLLVNKNKMLTRFEGATGIKTGYTKKAGRCLVTSTERNGMELVCVVLNCPPMFERSSELLGSCYSDYKCYKLVESDNIIAFIESEKGEIALGIKNDIVIPLTEEEVENIEVVYDYPNEVFDFSAFEIGKIEIYVKNNLIFTVTIYTIL